MFKRPRLPVRRTPQQARARATREHIQVAGLKALREEGEDVSMTRIAKVAGYSIGTVYQYYPDRRALLCDLMERTVEADAAAVMAEIPRFMELPLREGIARIVSTLVKSAADNVALNRAVMKEVLPGFSPDDLEDLVPRFAEVLAAQLRLRPELVRDCDLEMASFFVLNGVEAIVHATVMDRPQWLQSETFVHELVENVYRYLAP